MNVERAHQLAREHGVNPVFYWVRPRHPPAVLPALLPAHRFGTEHIPTEGPVLLAANHRSFSDPFMIGTCLGGRFASSRRWSSSRSAGRLASCCGWGAFRSGAASRTRSRWRPRARSSSRRRGRDLSEGTRVRPGPLAEPRRGIEGSRSRPERPLCPSRSLAPRTFAGDGASARAA